MYYGDGNVGGVNAFPDNSGTRHSAHLKAHLSFYFFFFFSRLQLWLVLASRMDEAVEVKTSSAIRDVQMWSG